MKSEQVAGVVRAILAGVGGYFVGRGLIDSANVEIIGGAIATIVTAVWSVWSKKAS